MAVADYKIPKLDLNKAKSSGALRAFSFNSTRNLTPKPGIKKTNIMKFEPELTDTILEDVITQKLILLTPTLTDPDFINCFFKDDKIYQDFFNILMGIKKPFELMDAFILSETSQKDPTLVFRDLSAGNRSLTDFINLHINVYEKSVNSTIIKMLKKNASQKKVSKMLDYFIESVRMIPSPILYLINRILTLSNRVSRYGEKMSLGFTFLRIVTPLLIKIGTQKGTEYQKNAVNFSKFIQGCVNKIVENGTSEYQDIDLKIMLFWKSCIIENKKINRCNDPKNITDRLNCNAISLMSLISFIEYIFDNWNKVNSVVDGVDTVKKNIDNLYLSLKI